MKKVLKWVGVALRSLVLLLILAAGAVYTVMNSESKAETQVAAPVSACQRITESGRHYITCDPILEGGPNLKDPEASRSVIRDARILGDPIYYPAFGDLWMPTWATMSSSS